MTLPKILFGVLIGISVTSYYHQKQITKQNQVFLECQEAWDKYYCLTNQTKRIQPLDPNQSFWQVILQGTLNKTQELITNSQEPFTLEQQKHLVYHYEVLPKCQKVKDWEKHMKYLSTHSKS